MKQLVMIAILAALAGGMTSAAIAGTMDPNLEAVLNETGDQEVLSVLVFLVDQVDLPVLTEQLERDGRPTRQRRHEVVVTSLQQRAAATQGDLMTRLEAFTTEGTVQGYHAFWIANCIRVEATKPAIKAIADRDDVLCVYPNYPIESIEPEVSQSDKSDKDQGGRDGRAPELGVQAVRAPEVWLMGFTGDGILVSSLDTGVDGNHPALANRWRGVADPRYQDNPEWAWFDPVTNTTFPQGWGSHGTHTMGTVCGGAPGDEVGVAPGAQWIHAAVIDRVSLAQTVADAILAFEWLVDPDGDPGTTWDVPHVCSNSWGIGTWHNIPPYNSPCDPSFWSYLDACEAAGTVILFSAGNEGPSSNTLRRPADRATDDYRTCAVGGINANDPPNWVMYTNSSRGPTYCTPTGNPAIKPEIAAPAVEVRSSIPGGGYSSFTGTSMASPHVNGVVALIREACPDLSVDEVKQIMYDTALDLGFTGKDNDYGYGLVDAFEAVNLALTMCSGAPKAEDGSYETPANTSVLVTLVAIDYDGLPDPPGYLTYIIDSLPANGTLNDPGAGSIDGVPYSLVDGGNIVEYKPNSWYFGDDSFTFKANDGGEPPDAGDSNIAIISIDVLPPAPEAVHLFTLDADPGWSIEGQWEFGQPTGGGTHNGDPTAGYTGNNVYGYNLAGDYPNNMPLYCLTTTAINCRDIQAAEARFRRWLGVERNPYDNATVAVSNDGSNWTTLWSNPDNTISDSSWTQIVLDISEVADQQQTVYLRWTMGTTDGNITYPGWNIDDVEIWGMFIPQCLGDLDCDGDIDLSDLSQLLSNYGMSSGANYNDGDIDGDHDVDLSDLSALLAVYGTTCP